MGFTARSLRLWLFSTSLVFVGWLIGIFTVTNTTKDSSTITDSSSAERLSSVSPATVTPVDSTSYIAADAKGNITLHVENQPLTWVLEQIQLQSGKSLTQSSHTPSTYTRSTYPQSTYTQSTAGTELSSCSAQQSSEEIMTKIHEGDESERYNSLAFAQQRKIKLPEETLKALYENDQSLHVRLLAYAYAIETFSGDSIALRSTLEDARLSSDDAIANDAEHRLAILARLEIQREKTFP